MSGHPDTPRRRRWVRRLLLILALGVTLLVAGVAYRLAVPPPPFPIPPDLALEYSQARFENPDNAWHLYWQTEEIREQLSAALRPSYSTLNPAAFERTDPAQWTTTQADLARRWLDDRRELLETVRAATVKPYFMERPPDPMMVIPYPSNVASVAKWLGYEAELALRVRDEDAALDALLTTLRAAHQLPHYGPLLNRTTARRLEEETADALLVFIAQGRISRPASLRRIVAALADLDRDRWPLANSLRWEYAALHHFLEQAGRGNPRDYLDTLRAHDRGGPTLFGLDWTDARMLWELRGRYPGAIAEFTAYFQRKVQALEKDFAAAIQNDLHERTHGVPELRGIFARQFPPGLFAFHEARTVAQTRAVLLLIALELHRRERGAFPKALDALMPDYLDTVPADPFDGLPLRYRRTADGIRVWSVGPDQRDGGGLPALDRAEVYNAEAGDIVWAFPPQP